MTRVQQAKNLIDAIREEVKRPPTLYSNRRLKRLREELFVSYETMPKADLDKVEAYNQQ